MADPSLNSHNPFRRKTTAAPALPSSPAAAPLDTAPLPTAASIAKSSTFPQAHSDADFYGLFPARPAASGASGFQDVPSRASDDTAVPLSHPHPTGDAFREQLMALPKSAEAPPSTTFLKAKPVKKVRVQSPPPSPSDSDDDDFEARFPSDVSAADSSATRLSGYGQRGSLLDDRPIRNYDDLSSESEDSDDNSAGHGYAPPLPGPLPVSGSSGVATGAAAPFQSRPPPNPFHKTLSDLEPGQKGEMEGAHMDAPQAGAIGLAGMAVSTTSAPAAAAAATTGAASKTKTAIETTVAAPSGKGTMDVDAFRRLLLTGQGPTEPFAAAPAADDGSMTDASIVTKHSVFEAAQAPQASHETPRTSHEASENDDDRSGLIQGAAQRQMQRKKPPPPSSRHGKLIKASPDDVHGPSEESADNAASRSRADGVSKSSALDANKPLPPPPARRSIDGHGGEDIDNDMLDSIFDREAAGKLPEVHFDPEVHFAPDALDDAVPSPHPSTPSQNRPALSVLPPSQPSADFGAEATASPGAPPSAPTLLPPPSHAKKSTPAPPPRRGHNRTESRPVAQDRSPSQVLASVEGPVDQQTSPQLPSQQRDRSPTGSVRSSLDSTRSRSSAMKPAAISAPAPPPPRRAGHVSRPSTSVISPSAMSFAASIAASGPSGVADKDRPLVAAGPLSPGMPTGEAGVGSVPVSSVGLTKLARPPPPPTRNPSVRPKDRPLVGLASDLSGGGSGSGRPSSVASVDAISRRIAHPQPPPPPPRQRGSSRGSMDGPATAATLPTPRRLSSESTRRAAPGGGGLSAAAQADGTGDDYDAHNADPTFADTGSSANDILADLDALQREVDALRGQYGKAGTR